jgi:hypothetical protein
MLLLLLLLLLLRPLLLLLAAVRVSLIAGEEDEDVAVATATADIPLLQQRVNLAFLFPVSFPFLRLNRSYRRNVSISKSSQINKVKIEFQFSVQSPLQKV